MLKLRDFECQTCGHVWEDWYETILPACPKCGSAFTSTILTKGPAVMGSAYERMKNRADNPESNPIKVFTGFKDKGGK